MSLNNRTIIDLKALYKVLLWCLTLASLLTLTLINPNFKVRANPGFVCNNPLSNVNLYSDTTNCSSDGDFSVTNVTVTNGATLNIYSKTKVELNSNFTVDANSRATIEVYLPPAPLPTTVSELKAALLAQHNLNFIDGDVAWNINELTWSLEALNTVKVKGGQLYDSSVLTTVKRYSVMKGNGPIGDCNNSGPTPLGPSGQYLANCKSIEIYNSILDSYYTDFRYKVSSVATSFKITLIHEITHAYQYLYPTKLINFANISWENLTPSGWTTDKKDSVTGCDMITDYALKDSREDMSETYALFYITPEKFVEVFNITKTNGLAEFDSLNYYPPCGANTLYTSSILYQKFMMAK